MLIGNKEFDTRNHCYVMGILNTTPDSFSDGGKYNTDDLALKHVEQMIEEGAAIIDVGGESTRPGFEKISIEEEIDRTAKIIEKIKQRFDIPVSIDSYKYEVAKAALEEGADMVNDIRGFRYNPNMAELTAKHNAACCLMHWREKAEYNDFIKDVLDDLTISIDIAKKGGVADNKIVLDPGVGFGKTREMNLEITNKVDKLKRDFIPIVLDNNDNILWVYNYAKNIDIVDYKTNGDIYLVCEEL